MNIQQELIRLSDPVRAEGERKYLKSPMKHYGVTVPVLRKIAKSHKSLSFNQAFALAQRLWGGESHEERMIAIFLMVYREKELKWEHFPFIEIMVRESTGWAQLDMIAAWLCGSLFRQYPAAMTQVMKAWVHDDNFWVQRAAILTLLGPVREDISCFPLFRELTVPLLSNKEFFIRKAIGWVLREVSKIYPGQVVAYTLEFGDRMSGLTYREATRKLPESLKAQLKDV